MENIPTVWKQIYKIVFKDEETRNKIITDKQYLRIKNKLFKNEWIEVDNELYNPFEIKKIVKFQSEDWIAQRLQKEAPYIQKKVKEYIRFDKKDITLSRLEVMIQKAKWIED